MFVINWKKAGIELPRDFNHDHPSMSEDPIVRLKWRLKIKFNRLTEKDKEKMTLGEKDIIKDMEKGWIPPPVSGYREWDKSC